MGGFNTTKVLDPANSPSTCNKGETPLACEYRITKPGIALILMGTGDQHTWQGFEGRYRTIIEYTINQGIIPVLITKGDDLEHRDNSALLRVHQRHHPPAQPRVRRAAAGPASGD